MIFSKFKLDEAIEFISETLDNNSFLQDLPQSVIRIKISI